MEDRAIEVLRIMLERRKLDTKTDRITPEGLERANAYMIGKVLVMFSQKEKGLQEKDINILVDFAVKNSYSNGIIIVSMQRPSENLLKAVKAFTKDRIQFFHLRQLQFDLTTHRYAMPHRIMSEEERKVMFEKYSIKGDADAREVLPQIDSQDPMAKWIGAIPGDIVEVTRHSDVAGQIYYPRYCVEDANVQ